LKDYLDFERPLLELEEKINRLKDISKHQPKTLDEIKRLQKKAYQLQEDIYSKLTAWQKTQIARHPNRPTTLDYIQLLITDFIELHGDRCFGEDAAIVGGLGKLGERPVVIIGHQKGKNVRERVKRNFGMPHPEGYRKAQRLMRLAEKFGRPLITFVDTPGAYPGMGAEERGQSEAIAKSLLVMGQISAPIVVIIIGEGGSGGALALAIGDRILMLEHSIYSVISPEGCAAILWNNAEKASEAAETLKMTGKDLLQLGVVDEVISEPLGGAHRDYPKIAEALRKAISHHLNKLEGLTLDEILRQRYEKFRRMGVFGEEGPLTDS
jgi:acetyl-CoA carboxylase carboxyl transferase subunit alpha